MTSKHTPGPWGYSEGYSGSFAIKAPSRRGASVTNVLPHIEIPDDEKEANARLIAAAPDLLAALEWAVAKLNCEPFEWADEDDANAHEAAIAAIAKAKGEPS